MTDFPKGKENLTKREGEDAIMGDLLVVYLTFLLAGALIGLVPFLVGRFMGKPVLGQLGLLCCALSGLFHISLPVLLALVFLGWIFLSKHDLVIRKSPAAQSGGSYQTTYAPTPQPQAGSLRLTCLTGPLRGRSYPIGPKGLMFGRDNDCAVCFPGETPGISRHHCAIRWQGNTPVLVDLNSTYGTFLSGGRQLPPNNPAALAVGTRFYLANTGVMFQIELG